MNRRLAVGSRAPTIGVLVASVLLACESSPKATRPAGEPIEARGGTQITVAEPRAVASAAQIDPRSAYPLEPGEEIWEIVDGREAGQPQHRVRLAADRFDADIAMRLGVQRTQYWARRGDDTVMTATHAHGDRAISLFDPPLPIATASLRRGEAHETTVDMTVVDENDLARVTQRGTATRRMTWVDDVEFSTPRGTVVAHRIETVFVADLNLARAEERATLLFVPEIGFVSEERIERIRAVAIFSRTVRQSLRRALPE